MANNKTKQPNAAEATDTNEEIIKKQLPQKVIQNPHIAFADSTMVMTSKFDVKIYCGVSMPTTEGGEVQYHTILSMSPQLAKAMAKSLTKALVDYEKEHMPLVMNDEK